MKKVVALMLLGLVVFTGGAKIYETAKVDVSPSESRSITVGAEVAPPDLLSVKA